MLPRISRVHLALGVTDMRKSINGLAVLAEQAMGKNVFSGDLFAFCNRSRNRVKILYWDQNGFCLWLKRLEEDRFQWPETEKEVMEIDREALDWLLAGLDLSQAHQRLNYQRVH